MCSTRKKSWRREITFQAINKKFFLTSLPFSLLHSVHPSHLFLLVSSASHCRSSTKNALMFSLLFGPIVFVGSPRKIPIASASSSIFPTKKKRAEEKCWSRTKLRFAKDLENLCILIRMFRARSLRDFTMMQERASFIMRNYENLMLSNIYSNRQQSSQREKGRKKSFNF